MNNLPPFAKLQSCGTFLHGTSDVPPVITSWYFSEIILYCHVDEKMSTAITEKQI